MASVSDAETTAIPDYNILNPDTFMWHEGVRHDPSIEYVRAYAEIERLGLQTYAAELDANGYTILPPDLVGPPGYVDRIRDQVLNAYERRLDITIDRGASLDDWEVSSSARERMNSSSFGLSLNCLVKEGEIFREILLNEANLALISYLIGSQAILYTYTALTKGPGSPAIDLHSDTFFMPPPWPPYAVLGQSIWLLSDFSKDDGATGFVPGSHRLGRLPREGEGLDRIVHVEAPAGSIIVFHGHLWHCAAPRTSPGHRSAIAMHFCRHWVQTQSDFRGTVPESVLAESPLRLRRLLHELPNYGDPSSNPCVDRFA